MRLFFLIIDERVIDISPAPAGEACIACESRVPVACSNIPSNLFAISMLEASVVPNLNGIKISAGLPFVKMVFPGLTSNLLPRGRRVASIAIIGTAVKARESR